MKNKLVKLIEKIHFLMFRHSMSQEMKKFLGNLSWSLSIGIFVMPLMMLVNTLAGRFMGPAEYGKYSLLLIINQFLIIFIFFGLDTVAVKNIAKAKTFTNKKNLISAISGYIYIVLTFFVIITSIAYPILLKYNKDYALLLVLITFYAVIVSLKIIHDLFIRGLEDFKKQAFGKIIEISVILVFFYLTFFVIKFNNFIGFIFVICSGALAIAVYYFIQLKKYLVISKFTNILKQPGEGKLFFLSALLGTIYLSSDRFAITRYLGVRELGIYSAYYLASFTMMAQLTQLFTNVFFPATARTKDKFFANKIDRLLMIGFIPLSLFISIVMILILLIFGKEYPINWIYITGFTLFSSSYFFLSLYFTIILDITKPQFNKFLWLSNSTNLIVIVIYILAIYLHILTIPFILLILIINNIITIYIERLFIRYMQK